MDTISAISNLLFIDKNFDKDSKIDLTIVLGNDWLETMDEVYKIYSDMNIGKIFISGGTVNKEIPESVSFKKRGVSLGIPSDNIIIEEQSRNTKENFQNLRALIQEEIGFENVKNILIVCKTFHTRRSLMTAKNFFPESINYFFLPLPDEREIYKDSWWKKYESRNRVLGEVERIAKYSLKGDLKLD